MVAWARPISSTRLPQTQLSVLKRYCKIATLAGCENALANWASWFCYTVNISDLVIPIVLIVTLQYYD